MMQLISKYTVLNFIKCRILFSVKVFVNKNFKNNVIFLLVFVIFLDLYSFVSIIVQFNNP